MSLPFSSLLPTGEKVAEGRMRGSGANSLQTSRH